MFYLSDLARRIHLCRLYIQERRRLGLPSTRAEARLRELEAQARSSEGTTVSAPPQSPTGTRASSSSFPSIYRGRNDDDADECTNVPIKAPSSIDIRISASPNLRFTQKPPEDMGVLSCPACGASGERKGFLYDASQSAYLCIGCALRRQEQENKRRSEDVDLRTPPEIEKIADGPYRGFYISKGEPKLDPARFEKCRREAEEFRQARDAWKSKLHQAHKAAQGSRVDANGGPQNFKEYTMALSRYLSGYFKAENFRGSKMLTIEKIEEEQMPRGGELKPVASFRETGQKLVLNQTRIRDLIRLFGTDEESELTGKRVVVYVGEAQVNGVPTPSLRFRAPSQERFSSEEKDPSSASSKSSEEETPF